VIVAEVPASAVREGGKACEAQALASPDQFALFVRASRLTAKPLYGGVTAITLSR
jgi:hypothetical protein